MKQTCGIYRITSPSQKIYIGQSVFCERRIRYYKTGNMNNQTHLKRSFDKYGWRKHKFEIIHECEKSQLDSLEKYYIELYQCFNNEFGLNLSSGGKNGKHAEITKTHLKSIRQGRKLSESHKEKIRLSLLGNKRTLGRKHPKEQEEKRQISRAGYRHSEETKAKIGRALRGVKRLNMSGDKHPRWGKKLSEEHLKKFKYLGKGFKKNKLQQEINFGT